jgi:hypothetical protein
MSETKFIGICGKKLSGKTTIAYDTLKYIGSNIIGSKNGGLIIASKGISWALEDNSYAILPFAFKLKEIVCDLFKIDMEEFENNKNDIIPGTSVTYRKALQWVGTELVRSLDPDLWVKNLDYLARYLFPFAKLIFVPDVRFSNELQFIKDSGGFNIYLTRCSTNSSDDIHASENSVQAVDCDFVIENHHMTFDQQREVFIDLLRDKLLL